MLHNAMDSNPLTLFCLVDGEATSNAFPVEIESTKTIGNLKDLIKTKIPDTFNGVDAKDLTLWRVSISDDDDNDLPVLLDSVPEKKKLKATTRLLKVFDTELPDDTIHVIVQRPPPVLTSIPARVSTPHLAHAWDRSRSVTPVQLTSVPKDHIEKELVVVLEGVSHRHTTDPVDPKDVESSQRRKLGPFYKRTLPYHKTATDTSLVMLGLELDKQARTSDNETLRSIVEDDIGTVGGHRVVVMVALFGSGKTATVIDLASKHFVVYCVCCSPGITVSPDFNDPNFITLAEDVERIYRTVINREQRGSSDPLDIDSDVKAFAGERVKLEFLARLLFLQLLLNNNPDLEPQQFFREQTTTGGAATIGELVYKLREYDNLTIQAMLGEVQTKLHLLLVPRRLGLVIALDEAQVAVTGILSGKLISPSALMKNRDALLDSKNQIQSKFRRGFLTPLSATLSNMQATLVILGTALSLQDADHVYSAVGKLTNFTRITDFPQFDEDDGEQDALGARRHVRL
ncbi:MAG: hypothetical protein JOS17DRAFT_49006 [Linnemannia elongata]|nr:MAG: hypothetical protein JOS17DRAFT_49006 [Linnemannia elongata]